MVSKYEDTVTITDNLDKDKGIPSLLDKSIALSFYSPPYWNYIDYDGGQGIGNKEHTYEAYLQSLKDVNECLIDKIIDGGRVVINVANMKSRKAIEGISYMMYPIVHDITYQMSKIGFTFYDEIIWNKMIHGHHSLGGKMLFGSYPYPPTPRILHAGFENILIFTKEGKRKVDKEIKEQSKLTKEEWREWTYGMWDIHTGSNKKHPATFPIELAERVIRLYSFVDDTVLDPFAGTGTTIHAANKWNRKGIGYEISQTYI